MRTEATPDPAPSDAVAVSVIVPRTSSPGSARSTAGPALSTSRSPTIGRRPGVAGAVEGDRAHVVAAVGDGRRVPRAGVRRARVGADVGPARRAGGRALQAHGGDARAAVGGRRRERHGAAQRARGDRRGDRRRHPVGGGGERLARVRRRRAVRGARRQRRARAAERAEDEQPGDVPAQPHRRDQPASSAGPAAAARSRRASSRASRIMPSRTDSATSSAGTPTTSIRRLRVPSAMKA